MDNAFIKRVVLNIAGMTGAILLWSAFGLWFIETQMSDSAGWLVGIAGITVIAGVVLIAAVFMLVMILGERW